MLNRALLMAAVAAGPLLIGSAGTFAQSVGGTVLPTIETAGLPDNEYDSDSDDPAFWVDPSDAAGSLVITAVKNGGMRVWDLQGRLVQTVNPVETADGSGRINNVDVAYDVALADGSRADVVVASDRGLDIIRFYRIDGGAAEPLTEITGAGAGRAFPTRPDVDEGPDQDNPVDDQHTVYGLAAYHDAASDSLWVVGTQRTEPRVGVFRAVPGPDGTLSAELVHDFRAPDVHDGQDLRVESDDDPLMDWNPQFEGVVVDRRNGTVYAGEEDVGLWRFSISTGAGDAEPFYETRGASTSSFNNPDSIVARDVEGLTIFYAGDTAYLIASSQGGAHGGDGLADPPYDDTFVVFDISNADPVLLGSFSVVANGGIDAVQESDGADVISLGLPGWPNGLFVTQDGYNDDLDNLSGEVDASNFKYVDWRAIAETFDPPLVVAPDVFDPRQP